MFDPLAESYQNQTLDQVYHRHEEEKKWAYNERVLQVENRTFTLLVYTAAGAMGPECLAFYKQLTSLLADKRGQSFLQCQLGSA